MVFGIVIAGWCGFSVTAGAAPAQVQFNLQDGNTAVGFRYDPPHAHRAGAADHDAIFIPLDDSALFSSSPDVHFTLLHFTGHKIFEHPAAHALSVLEIAGWIAQRF